ncbi:MAG: antibiotic biosynthesis monooxygenase family protein [Candidatus Hodarchaeales archaeon]|jgi:heme-degrading monooxygenase HmoA
MVQVIGHLKVEDFKKFQQVFTSRKDLRKAAGSQSSKILVNPSNKTDVTLLFEWDSPESFKKFFETDDMKKASKNASVIGQPEVFILENVNSFDA